VKHAESLVRAERFFNGPSGTHMVTITGASRLAGYQPDCFVLFCVTPTVNWVDLISFCHKTVDSRGSSIECVTFHWFVVVCSDARFGCSSGLRDSSRIWIAAMFP